MSKKVVAFLVALFAITATVIFIAKTTYIVHTDAPQAQEAAATPAATTDTAATDTPASASDTPATETAATETATPAPAPADAATGDTPVGSDKPADTATAPAEEHTDGILGDENPVAAANAENADEADKTKAETALNATASQGGSLLSPSASMEVDMDNALAERSMGDVDAPVTVIEYASMTCPHCARFHNDILPVVKQRLIDTGKLRLIFRDYPLDTHALKAAMMARCTDRSRFFNLVEVIFKKQTDWVSGTDPMVGLKQLGALAGMEPAYIDSCVENPQLQQFLLAGMQEGQNKYKIKATPTFVFNNGAEQMEGDKNPEDFDQVVEKLMKKGK